MTRLSTSLAALLLLLATGPLAGQNQCAITDSPATCYDVYLRGKAANALANESKKIIDESVKTSDSEGQSTGSNLKNSLQVLEFLGLVNDGEAESDGSVKIDFNRLLPRKWKNVGGQLEGLLNTTPEIFEPLKMALPEEGRKEALAGLEPRVKDGTDLTVSLTFDVINKSIGRDLKAWRPIYADLFRGAIDRAMQGVEVPSLAKAVQQFVPKDDSPDIDFETPFLTMAKNRLGDEDEAKNRAEEWLEIFEEALLAETKLEEKIDEEVAAIKLNDFPKLLNNQPQLYFSTSHRFRDELVGQEETRYKLTWEQPMAPNVNRLREYATRKKLSVGDALPGYVAEHDNELEASHRFSFSAEYVDTRDLTIDLPELDFDKTFEGGHKLVASAGWGRQIGLDAEGNATSRFDLKISYENISDPNPDLRVDSRWLASLNFSQKVGVVSIPLTIVYSNKSEFLALQGLDEQISAHVGFKFTQN